MRDPHALKSLPRGAESKLAENVASPFHAEPRHTKLRARGIELTAKLSWGSSRQSFEFRFCRILSEDQEM